MQIANDKTFNNCSIDISIKNPIGHLLPASANNGDLFGLKNNSNEYDWYYYNGAIWIQVTRGSFANPFQTLGTLDNYDGNQIEIDNLTFISSCTFSPSTPSDPNALYLYSDSGFFFGSPNNDSVPLFFSQNNTPIAQLIIAYVFGTDPNDNNNLSNSIYNFSVSGNDTTGVITLDFTAQPFQSVNVDETFIFKLTYATPFQVPPFVILIPSNMPIYTNVNTISYSSADDSFTITVPRIGPTSAIMTFSYIVIGAGTV